MTWLWLWLLFRTVDIYVAYYQVFPSTLCFKCCIDSHKDHQEQQLNLKVLYSSWAMSLQRRESTSCSVKWRRDARALALTPVRSLKIVFVKSLEIPHVKLLGSSDSLNSWSVSREESWSQKTSGRSFKWGFIVLFFLQGPQLTGILGTPTGLPKVFSWFSWNVISRLGGSLGGTPVGIWIQRRLRSVEDF